MDGILTQLSDEWQWTRESLLPNIRNTLQIEDNYEWKLTFEAIIFRLP
jgi:hypothetical protein